MFTNCGLTTLSETFFHYYTNMMPNSLLSLKNPLALGARGLF